VKGKKGSFSSPKKKPTPNFLEKKRNGFQQKLKPVGKE